MTDYAQVRIDIRIAVPTDREAVEAALVKINSEIGTDRQRHSYEDFIDPEWERDPHGPEDQDGFDPSDFAFFVLNNRDVSPTAEEHVTYVDYEVYD